MQAVENPSANPAVIIVGPPWARSGTARVIQNQIAYYRSRGYFTLFIAVAIHPHYMRGAAVWDVFKEGSDDFGADRVVIAALDPKMFAATKLTATIRHGLRGTAMDWIVDTGRSAQLTTDDVAFIRRLPVAFIQVNHVFTLGFALRMRKQWVREGNSIPIILETHDIQAHLLRDYGYRNPWRRGPDSLKRLIPAETALLSKADVLVHLSVDDNKFFRKQLPDKPHVLAMPTIDESFVSAVNRACPQSVGPIDLLFVGQSHGPNLAAITWFLGKVWPLIVDRRYRLKIVGAVEGMVKGKQPQMYEAFQSCFAGQVADLAPYYRAARCVLAPMVSGSGISIKTIEALALGKPFVGTSKAYRGMPMERIAQAGLQAHDDPQAFADAIVCALSAEQSVGILSRAVYDSIFSVQASFASRDEAINLATRK